MNGYEEFRRSKIDPKYHDSNPKELNTYHEHNGKYYELSYHDLHYVKLTVKDVAIALMIIYNLSLPLYRNSDGSLPTARIKALWRSLYQAEDVGRSFNTDRWSKIRNTLAANNLIKVKDRRNSSRHHQGFAMKWCIHPRIAELYHQAMRLLTAYKTTLPQKTPNTEVKDGDTIENIAPPGVPPGFFLGEVSFVLGPEDNRTLPKDGRQGFEMIKKPFRQVIRKIKPHKWLPEYFWGNSHFDQEKRRFVRW